MPVLILAVIFLTTAIRSTTAGHCWHSYQCLSTCQRTRSIYSPCGGFYCTRYFISTYACYKTCNKLGCCAGYVGANCDELSEKEGKDTRLSGGAITGIVFGSLVGLGILIFIVVMVVKKCQCVYCCNNNSVQAFSS